MRPVADGQIDRIVWQTSRLTRNRVERATAFELVKQHRIVVTAVEGMDFDFRTAQGRSMANNVLNWDTSESEAEGERVAAVRAMREEGVAEDAVVVEDTRVHRDSQRASQVAAKEDLGVGPVVEPSDFFRDGTTE